MCTNNAWHPIARLGMITNYDSQLKNVVLFVW